MCVCECVGESVCYACDVCVSANFLLCFSCSFGKEYEFRRENEKARRTRNWKKKYKEKEREEASVNAWKTKQNEVENSKVLFKSAEM